MTGQQPMARMAPLACVAALLLGFTLPAAAHTTTVGKASAVNQSTHGQPPGGSMRVVHLGDRIVHNEHITTDKHGQAQLLLADGTTFTIGPNSDLTINSFVYNPHKGTAKVVATLSKGAFRFVGGRTSKTPGGAKVHTPVGTVGIRGGIADIDLRHRQAEAQRAKREAARRAAEQRARLAKKRAAQEKARREAATRKKLQRQRQQALSARQKRAAEQRAQRARKRAAQEKAKREAAAREKLQKQHQQALSGHQKAQKPEKSKRHRNTVPDRVQTSTHGTPTHFDLLFGHRLTLRTNDGRTLHIDQAGLSIGVAPDGTAYLLVTPRAWHRTMQRRFDGTPGRHGGAHTVPTDTMVKAASILAPGTGGGGGRGSSCGPGTSVEQSFSDPAAS